MAFNGTLFYLGGVPFPTKYIFRESYTVAPHLVQDLDSGRNASGYLERNILDHHVSTISFDTKPMWNDELAEMMSFIRSKYTNVSGKEVRVKYFCPDTNEYDEGTFYMPDITFPIIRIEEKRILFNSVTLEFIEK